MKEMLDGVNNYRLFDTLDINQTLDPQKLFTFVAGQSV